MRISDKRMEKQMIYFIVNATSRSGKGLIIWKKVKEILASENVEYKAYRTKYSHHATELANKITSKNEELINIVVLGGDGTINEVINGIADFEKVRFGVIPSGSGNDFAIGLGIKGKPEEIIRSIIKQEKCSYIDIGKVTWNKNNSRLFAISSGIGLDAIVTKKTNTSNLKRVLNKIKLGKLTYVILTVQTLFSMDTFCVRLEDENDNVKLYNKMIFMACMNFRAEGGGVPMAPGASATDGKLSIASASGIPKWKTFFCLPLLVMAKHNGIKGFEIFESRACTISSDKSVVLHTDGEYIDDVNNVRYECLKGKLCMINEVKNGVK